MPARRYKAYAAITGVAYRYFFESRRSVIRPEGQGAGSDYVFVVMADQGFPFIARVFVSDRAGTAWYEFTGRPLDSNETYAAAKMRLFQAFDECARLKDHALLLVADEQNIQELLEPLDLA